MKLERRVLAWAPLCQKPIASRPIIWHRLDRLDSAKAQEVLQAEAAEPAAGARYE